MSTPESLDPKTVKMLWDQNQHKSQDKTSQSHKKKRTENITQVIADGIQDNVISDEAYTEETGLDPWINSETPESPQIENTDNHSRDCIIKISKSPEEKDLRKENTEIPDLRRKISEFDAERAELTRMIAEALKMTKEERTRRAVENAKLKARI
ncbi:hypothetical protein C2G38_2178190 [Gigaspora rosea]|uniref:Uncharacterized protein n=1 Tax=Gigaspora rosea TaxID=44941 RepID=A0A397VLW8_9GLOM|nr:hypothetical protein C2G38_2178190 [Gigaspora rosea]